MLTHTATWKNLGDVTPSEISQVQKVLIDSRHLRCPGQRQTHRDKKETGGCQELGNGGSLRDREGSSLEW